jgi:IS30 family transposase
MAKTTSKSKQGYYSNYKANSRWKTNRERKLKKLQKLQPNNPQIAEALKNMVYRRKTPGTVGQWSKTNLQAWQVMICSVAMKRFEVLLYI